MSKLGNIEITPAEEKKRQLRALRFQSDSEPKQKSPPPVIAVKKKKAFTPITWTDAPALNHVIVGTSTALEKPYFRLTSVSIKRIQSSFVFAKKNIGCRSCNSQTSGYFKKGF